MFILPDLGRMFKNLRGTLDNVQKWGWEVLPFGVQLRLGTLLSFGADSTDGQLAKGVIDPDVGDAHTALDFQARQLETEFQVNEQRLRELFGANGVNVDQGLTTAYREKLDLARRARLEANPSPEAHGQLQELQARSAERVLEALDVADFEEAMNLGSRNMTIRNSLAALEETHLAIDHHKKLRETEIDAPSTEQLLYVQRMSQELPQDYNLSFLGITLPELDKLVERVLQTTRPIHRILAKTLGDIFDAIKDFSNRVLRRKAEAAEPPKTEQPKTIQDLVDEQISDLPRTRGADIPRTRETDAPDTPRTSAHAVRTDIGRLSDAIRANREDVRSGKVSPEELAAETQSNMSSRSGQTMFMAPQPEDQVILQKSFADVFDSGAKDNLPVYSNAELIADTQRVIAKHGYDPGQSARDLQPIIEQLGRPNLVALRGALLNLDYTSMRTAQAASRVLNLPLKVEAGVRDEAYTSLLSWVRAQQSLNTAYRTTLRGLGQMFRVPTVPREPPIGGAARPRIDVAEYIARETQRATEGTAAQTLGERISPKLEAQMNRISKGEKPNFSDPELRLELEELAIIAKDFEVAPELRSSVLDRIADTAGMHFEGLMTLRMASLLSSGTTAWVNTISGLYRLLTEPVATTLGAISRPGTFGQAATAGVRQYVAIVMQLRAAGRLAGLSFKHGVGLWDPSHMSVDALDKMAKSSVDGTITLEPERWSLNQPPSEHFVNRLPAIKPAMMFLWRTSGLPVRLLSATDTLFKAIGGNANHWVRKYDEAYSLAKRRGMEGQTARDWASKYAEQSLANDFRDVLIKQQDGRETRIRNGAMVDPHALTYGRNLTFTDSLWARPERRTFTKGLEIAGRRGIADPNEQAKFAVDYLAGNRGRTFPEVIMGHTRPLSAIPQAINQLKAQPGIGPLVTVVAPFIKTPTNIVKAALRFSPAAPMVDTWWRDLLSNDKLTRQQAVGQVAFGSIVVGGLMGALNEDKVEFTGGGPREYQARLKWVNELQKRPYSWRTRRADGSWGPWNSYRSFEPVATQLGMIADWREMSNSMTIEQQHGSGGTLVLDLATRSSTGLLGKNWFQGFEELIVAIERVNREGFGREGRRNPLWRWFTRTAVTFTPMSSMARRATRTIDPTVRVVPAGGAGEELVNEWRKLVPGWSRNLPPARNTITGEVVTIGGLLGRRWVNEDAPLYYGANQFSPFSAADTWQGLNDFVLNELGKLHQDGATFSAPSRRRFTLNGKIPQNVMSENEWNYWVGLRTTQRIQGQTLHEALNSTIRTVEYQELSDGTVPSRVIDGEVVERRRSRNVQNEKAEYLKGIIKRYDQEADRIFMSQKNEQHVAARININLARFGRVEQNMSRVDRLTPASQAAIYREAATLSGNQ